MLLLADLKWHAVSSELMTGLRTLGLYLVRVVKGNNAQRPEAAEHGENGEA